MRISEKPHVEVMYAFIASRIRSVNFIVYSHLLCYSPRANSNASSTFSITSPDCVVKILRRRSSHLCTPQSFDPMDLHHFVATFNTHVHIHGNTVLLSSPSSGHCGKQTKKVSRLALVASPCRNSTISSVRPDSYSGSLPRISRPHFDNTNTNASSMG